MKIWKQFNKQAKRDFWHSRFRLNKKPFTPKAETKEALLNLIAEIRQQEKAEKDNQKFGTKADIVYYVPTLEKLFEEIFPTITNNNQKTLVTRVFRAFLSLLPSQIKVDELTTRHFQLYINHRKGQIGKQSKKPIKTGTIYKELYCMSGNIGEAIKAYEFAENWKVPDLPEFPKGEKRKKKRERVVAEAELSAVINELMKKPEGKQTFAHHFARVRLAHFLEFGYLTGFRRKELSRLKFAQYDEKNKCLLNVKRFKTDTATRFFPLGIRAIEIIEERREAQGESEFIFTPDGIPIASNYRTLKNVCQKLKIPYGKFSEDGFIPHDLRHSFASEIIPFTDIKTAQTLLGHSNISQTADYLHTNPSRMREAIRKLEKVDYDSQLKAIFKEVKNGKLNDEKFAENVKNLFGF